MMIFTLNGVIFEWDDEKYNLVLQQYNVTFEEACSVFFDEMSISKEDKRKYDEIRRVTTGMSNQARLLTVIWTYRGNNIRLITAFKSTKNQQKWYSNG